MERRIYGSAVYIVEDLGLVPLSGDPKRHDKSVRCTKIVERVDPTDDELDAMAAAGRVDAGIRAALGIEAEGSNRAVVERSASGAGKGASSARAGRGGVPGRSA